MSTSPTVGCHNAHYDTRYAVTSIAVAPRSVRPTIVASTMAIRGSSVLNGAQSLTSCPLGLSTLVISNELVLIFIPLLSTRPVGVTLRNIRSGLDGVGVGHHRRNVSLPTITDDSPLAPSKRGRPHSEGFRRVSDAPRRPVSSNCYGRVPQALLPYLPVISGTRQ